MSYMGKKNPLAPGQFLPMKRALQKYPRVEYVAKVFIPVIPSLLRHLRLSMSLY